MSWGAATDNVGVLRYNVHRGTSSRLHALVGEPDRAADARPATSTTTSPGSYFYRVTAEDAAGNIGAALERGGRDRQRRHDRAERAERADRAGDRQHRQPQLDGLDRRRRRRPLQRPPRHAAPASPPAPPTGSRNRPGPATPTRGLATGSYFYKVTAEDAAGNISAASNEATATVADATPPSAPATSPPPSPAAPSTSAGAPPPTTSPSAATTSTAAPRSGFTPTTANRIAQPTGLSYADTGLAPGSYFYKLTAEDAAGNIGPLSNTASATVADTTPPSTPTLTANGGAGQASLSWTAATDNVAVTRYNLHRSTSSGFTPTTANRIAQPTSTSYTDTGLTAGTYYYKLTAEDAAGNISPASNQATATVTAPTRHRPRRRLRLRRRHRHHHHRPIRHRQQRHPHQHHLGRPARQIRQRPHLQRHQRLRHHPRHQQPRPHHRHDPRSLGPTHRPRQRLPHRADEGAARATTPTALYANGSGDEPARSARSTSAATATRSAPRSCR